jgi:hypothetical protein
MFFQDYGNYKRKKITTLNPNEQNIKGWNWKEKKNDNKKKIQNKSTTQILINIKSNDEIKKKKN